MLRHIPRWVLTAIVLFWVGSLFTDLLALRLDPEFDAQAARWPHILAKRGLLSTYWIVATVGALEAMRGRVGIDAHARVFVRGALFASLACAGFIAWFGLVITALSRGARGWLEALGLFGALDVMTALFTAAAIVVVAGTYDYTRRASLREREAERLRLRLAQTELALLRGQLEPHFLFNALNSIASLVRLQRPVDAVDALARLGELLRGVLDVGQRHDVEWSWERRFTEAYVALQALRFGDRLVVDIDTDLPGPTRVPPLLLQPLIENAIRHGPLDDGGRCDVDVRVAREHDDVVVRVANPVGSGSRVDGTRVGLANLEARLGRLYGDAARCDAGSVDATRFEVVVRFPFVANEGRPG